MQLINMRTKTICCKIFSQAHGNGFNIVAIKQPFNPLDNVSKEGGSYAKSYAFIVRSSEPVLGFK